jgi:hypothetical protein
VVICFLSGVGRNLVLAAAPQNAQIWFLSTAVDTIEPLTIDDEDSDEDPLGHVPTLSKCNSRLAIVSKLCDG